jgi:hypothetical protein
MIYDKGKFSFFGEVLYRQSIVEEARMKVTGNTM